MGLEIRTWVLFLSLIHTSPEEFPSRALVSHTDLPPNCQSNLGSLCEQPIPPHLTSSFTLNCSLHLRLNSDSKIKTRDCFRFSFQWQNRFKSKNALCPSFGKRKWEVPVLLLKLEWSSTFFSYCYLISYCSAFLPLAPCRCLWAGCELSQKQVWLIPAVPGEAVVGPSLSLGAHPCEESMAIVDGHVLSCTSCMALGIWELPFVVSFIKKKI